MKFIGIVFTALLFLYPLFRRWSESFYFAERVVYEAFFLWYVFPETRVLVAFWSRVYTSLGREGGRGEVARAATGSKNRPIQRPRIHICMHAYIFFRSTNFPRLPLWRPPAFGNRASATRASAYLFTHARHTFIYSRCDGGTTSILPRATLFSILTTAARERADVFFFPGTK